MADKPKTWTYAVVAASASGQTKFFGMADSVEDATALQNNALAIGRKTAKIVDSSLLEVKEDPEER